MKLTFLKTILQSLLTSMVVLIGVGGMVAVAHAATIEVDFAATPLFLDAAVVPGDSATRTVTVRNTGTVDASLFMSVQNTFNTGLADVMQLTVAADSTTYYSGSFADFFAAAPHSLGDVAAGDVRTFTFTASLAAATGNAYQLTQFGFDLLIGVPGGPTFTDTPTGGGGGGQSLFSLFNETVDDSSAALGAVTITWNTNVDATSYIVCGDLSTAESFVLDPDSPRFGYQFVVPENTTRVVGHSVELTGLAPSTYECRPASRRSLSNAFSVGIPLRFTIPTGEVLGAATAAPVIAAQSITPRTWPGTGSVMGASTKGAFGGPTYDEWRAQQAAERAAREVGTSTTSPADENVAGEGDVVTSGAEAGFGLSAAPTPQTVRQFWVIGLVVLLIGGLVWYLRRPR